MSKAYQLKITIKGSSPPLWRRVLVPEHITFYDLDDIIEELFGWTHDHMFSFDFHNRNKSFVGSPMRSDDFEDGDDTWVCIDEYMTEGSTFIYTYDFGDDWKHTIKVEKIVVYDARYPQVLASKGPNMIEDCGGIWGFEELCSEASEFDMEAVNETFRQWDFPITEPINHENKIGVPNNMMELFEDMMEQFQRQKEEIRKCITPPASLAKVLETFTKNDMVNMAKAHGFKGYQRLNKKELAEWLKNRLLDMDYVRDVLFKISREDIELFECAIEENGVCAARSFIEDSLFLASYGAFIEDIDFYLVPDDVKEVYKKAATPEVKAQMETEWNFLTWCDAVIYLYGVISVEKFTEIYNLYEKKNLSAEEVEHTIRHLMETEECYALIDGYLMDEQLAEQNMYQNVLKIQGDLPYYMPKDREEFLDYGEKECQMPNEQTEFFVEYLQETGRMSYEQAMILFYYIQDAYRMNEGAEELLELLEDAGLNLNVQKARKKAWAMLERYGNSIRTWDERGHTFAEVQNIKQEASQAKEDSSKVIQFPVGKNIYPNDPCPCGSGKKYKHCCGKQR